MLQTHGDDVDDEEFTIQIKFDIFAFPEVDPRISMEKVEAAAQVSCKQGEVSMQGPRRKQGFKPVVLPIATLMSSWVEK